MRLILALAITFCFTAANCVTGVDSVTFESHYNKGLDSLGIDIPKRIAFRTYCLSEATRLGMNEHWIIDKVAYYLGQDYARIGDFDNALKINANLTLHYDSTQAYYDLVWCYIDRAVYHQNQQEYPLAIQSLENGIKLAKQFHQQECLVDLYDGFSSTYTYMGQYNKSKYYLDLQQAQLNNPANPAIDELSMYYQFNRAIYLEGIGNRTQAIDAYLDCLGYARKIGSRKGMHAMVRLSQLYLDLNQPIKAEETLTDFLNFYVAGDASYKEAYLLSAYNLLARVYHRLKKDNLALKWVTKAESLAQYFHAEYQFTNSKFFIDEIRRENLELGVRISYALFLKSKDTKYVLKALTYADNAKSNVLNERLSLSKKFKNTSIPEPTLAFWYDLNKQLYDFRDKGDVTSSSHIRSQLDSLEHHIGLDGSQNFGSHDIEQVQNSLNQGELILEYSIYGDQLFVFVIDHVSVSMHELNDFSPESSTTFHQLASNPSSSLNDYKRIGYKLFSSLVEPYLRGHKPIRKLIIIPDGVLQYIQFDALSTDLSGKNWGDLPYLIRRCTVSYDFSLNTRLNSSITNYTTTYCGFTSDYIHSTKLPNLQLGVNRITSTARLLNGESYINQEATSHQLLTAHVNTNILHLHTHGISNDSSYRSSYIHLYDKPVFVDEIMESSVQSNLCLLTACEVGLGKRFNGEGITGVAWAFKVAGSTNVVQSLWKLNELSTDRLTNYFVNNLHDHQESSLALQNAKRRYIEDPEITNRHKHPFFWAGLTHFGSGYQLPKKFNYLGVISILIVLTLVGFLIMRNRL
ncbi:MAG: CHAT domain-containing protein [Flavobacteriales bacterium]|nr:CHAT domain-containing protein [Bacteroidota bacterium]MCB9241673.1 CHAT domain-containing protein [Flavobacteriales bacterium]